jgi:hypothetical protein
VLLYYYYILCSNDSIRFDSIQFNSIRFDSIRFDPIHFLFFITLTKTMMLLLIYRTLFRSLSHTTIEISKYRISFIRSKLLFRDSLTAKQGLRRSIFLCISSHRTLLLLANKDHHSPRINQVNHVSTSPSYIAVIISPSRANKNRREAYRKIVV